MTNLTVAGKATLLAVVLGNLLALAGNAHASDRKVFSAVSYCMPYVSSAPDYAQLRFRAEGIINDSDTSKFVICNIARDEEDEWTVEGGFTAGAIFRRTKAGSPALTSNQCTWSVGNNYSEPQQSVTIPVAPVPGSTTYGYSVLGADLPSNDYNSYGIAVCRIAPGALLEFFVLQENITNVPPAP